MTSFLLFTIHAPLASWGDIAVGEWRGSWDRPSRSAIIGLLGAALGVARHDADGQRALRDDYRIGVRGDALGTPMQDYHTMQTVAKSNLKKNAPTSRAELLSFSPKETVLSRREYRQGVVCTIAVWAVAEARWPLADIAVALQSPVYSLYAGRRSNPLGLPVRPSVTEATTLAEAFSSRTPLPDNTPSELQMLRPRQGWGAEVAHDHCDGFESGLVAPFRRLLRRDVPVNRTGWLFEERIMLIGMLPRIGDRA